MAKNDNIKGVASIKIGPPGDGVVGTSLTTFDKVVLSSLSLSGAEANETTIATEQTDSYLTLSEGSTPATATFRLYEIHGADAVMLMGGSYDSATKTWKAPVSVPDKYLSVVVTSESIDGQHAEITFPYAKVVARHEGSITKNDLLSVEVTLTANTPVTAAGVENAPYEIKFV